MFLILGLILVELGRIRAMCVGEGDSLSTGSSIIKILSVVPSCIKHIGGWLKSRLRQIPIRRVRTLKMRRLNISKERGFEYEMVEHTETIWGSPSATNSPIEDGKKSEP